MFPWSNENVSPSTGRGQTHMLENRKRAEEAKLQAREAAIERRLRTERQRGELAKVMSSRSRTQPAPLMTATELRAAVSQDEGLKRLEQRLKAAYVTQTRDVQVKEKYEQREVEAAAERAAAEAAATEAAKTAAREAARVALEREKAIAIDAERKAIAEAQDYQNALKAFVVRCRDARCRMPPLSLCAALRVN